MKDLIERQAAIEAIEKHIRTAEEPYQLTDADKVMNHAFEIAASCVYNLSATEADVPDINDGDMISRQAAIDAINGVLVEDDACKVWFRLALQNLPSAQPEPIKINIEDFNKEDCERLKKEWGNTPITVLPAQPEIIRCKDCKYAEVADKEDGQDGYTCQFHRGSIWFSGSYCSWAERRQNE